MYVSRKKKKGQKTKPHSHQDLESKEKNLSFKVQLLACQPFNGTKIYSVGFIYFHYSTQINDIGSCNLSLETWRLD